MELVYYIFLFLFSVCFYILTSGKKNIETVTIFIIIIAVGFLLLSNAVNSNRIQMKYFFTYLVTLSILSGSSLHEKMDYLFEYIICILLFIFLTYIDYLLAVKYHLDIYYPFLPLFFIIFFLINVSIKAFKAKLYCHVLSSIIFSLIFFYMIYNSIVKNLKTYNSVLCYVLAIIGVLLFIIGSFKKNKIFFLLKRLKNGD
jgi:hypothetical protein